jgi:hypothetical protein
VPDTSPAPVVVTVPKTRQLEPASESTFILMGAIGLATLFACAIGYATSRAIGAPMTQLLENAQLARNGNIELMVDMNTGFREIDETGEILKEFATQRRRAVASERASARELPAADRPGAAFRARRLLVPGSPCCG